MVKILADDLHVLTGSYALDALPDPERAEFERHLQHCSSCDAEVRGLRETAARMAMAQAVQPPPEMEQRVLAAAYRTRQLPPLPADRHHRRRAQVSELFAGPPAGSPGAWPPSPPPRAWPRPSLLASRSCPLSTSSSRRGRARPRSAGSSPPPTRASRRPGRGRAESSPWSPPPRCGQAVVTAAGLVPAVPGGCDQVWVMSPSGARSAGLMGPQHPAGVRRGAR